MNELYPFELFIGIIIYIYILFAGIRLGIFSKETDEAMHNLKH